MMKPLIYFSFGMTKTASTLAYHLAHIALEDTGMAQPQIPPPAVAADRKINFVTHLDERHIDQLWTLAQSLGHPLLVKTHTRPDPAVIAMIKDGRAIGSAAYRDPRDMALSMLDHGIKARRMGVQPFSEMVTLEDALHGIRGQVNDLAQWLRLPNILPLDFEDIAFDTKKTAARILNHLGINGSPAALSTKAKDCFTQFNKGISARHVAEMSAKDSSRIAREFAPLIAFLNHPHGPLPANTPLRYLDNTL
ncbi:MAG: sulfotransferase domain-containing protein [Paracoccaceae bacterium]